MRKTFFNTKWYFPTDSLEVTQLKNLNQLDLTKNRIVDISIELAARNSLQISYLDENALVKFSK
jgi:Leucine-rich repeat (LRR) protein